MSLMDRFDRIVLSKEDLDSLFKWRDNHKDYVRNFKPTLTEGIIEVGDSHTQFFRKLKDEHYQYSVIKNDTRVFEIIWDKKTKNVVTIVDKLELNKDMKYEFIKSVISLHASTMAYIEYYGDKREYVNVKTKQINNKLNNSAPTRKNKKKRKSVKLKTKKIYSISIDNEAIKRDKRRYERKTAGWSVRGFWRTYKSGKRVWINPYLKGDKRNIEPKDYEI